MTPVKTLPVFLAIVGPTAGGKTAIALELAREIKADILSVDSMKVYRGMDIGTAKPRGVEREGVVWHGLDLAKACDSFTTADFIDHAKTIFANRSKPLILEGGTPLYFKALIDGLFEGPEADWDLRRALEARAVAEGSASLHDELKHSDPDAADRIHPNDLRRIIRALEVFKLAGKPITQLQMERTAAPVEAQFRFIGIDRGRDNLYERINSRVLKMFEEGLLSETNLLLQQGGFSREAGQALGYKEVLEYLDGKYSLEECIDLVQRRTRAFSRRQRSWLKQFPNCEWNELKEGEESILCDKLFQSFPK